VVHESRTHVTLALDRASISDGLWTVPGPDGDIPWPLFVLVGGIEPCWGEPVTYASSFTCLWVSWWALLKR